MTVAAKRRWLQFSLRTLLVAVTLVSGLASWTAYHLDWIRQRRAVLANESISVPIACSFAQEDWDTPPWPLAWFGEQGARSSEFSLPAKTPDDEIARIQKLFPETRVVRAR